MLKIEHVNQIAKHLVNIPYVEWAHILIQLDQREDLDLFMGMINHQDLLPNYHKCKFLGNGKIVVIGDSTIDRQVIEEILKDNGINKERLELINDFKDIKRYEFKKMRFQITKYAAVFVGPIPHKIKGLNSYSSMISQMERDEGYPPVFRLIDSHNQLIINRSTLSKAIKEAKDRRIIINVLN